jgi:purine-cytosine permease-like protein
MNEAIFVQSGWLVIFPAMVIGLSLGGLFFVIVERSFIPLPALISFMVRYVLWLVIGLRRIHIIDQSDVIIVVLEFVIMCFLVYSTQAQYKEERRRDVLRVAAKRKEEKLEAQFNHHTIVNENE